MIAKITPLSRLPSRADVFDYFVPDDLRAAIKPGSLVNIPFRASKVAGVVLELTHAQESEKFRARPIDSVLEDEPILTHFQLRLIKKFSEYYFVTPGSVARLMVPDRPERMTNVKPMTYTHISFTVSPAQLPKLKSATARIASARLLIIRDVSSFVWLLLHLVARRKQSPLLVLVPTIEMIEAIAGSVHKVCSDGLTVIHSGLSKGQHWNEYQKILRGKARMILSTRQGVFLPIRENSQIIFFDGTSEDFKQYDQHPRYDARIVGSWLANITKSKLLFASSSEILSEKRVAHTALPASHGHKLGVSLVDMKNEMNRKDFSIIAGQTLEAIQGALKQNKKAVVIALREESDKGVSVKGVLQILTRELKNCNVRASLEHFDVLVATPQALEGLKLSSEKRNLGLLVFASIEPLLAIPDYRSAERTYYRLSHWRLLAQELGFERIILQSYSPLSLAVRAFAYGEFEAFKTAELSSRKELNYPPFAKLIKLSYRGKDQNEVLSAKRRLMNASPPFMDAKKRQSLLIKLSGDARPAELFNLGQDWIIDRDPENVI
ncbi:MAG: hypothetical protein HYW81_03345 [Parcubacteria group bacterium]|nr:hypothetical protein [Parcubacteria group bacterium]